jgi:hypothetical protein
MIQRGCGTRLLGEPLQTISIRGEQGWQNLERDLAVQSPIERGIDLAHSARTDRGSNLVRAKSCTGLQRHARSIIT